MSSRFSPTWCDPALSFSILKRAQEAGSLEVHVHDLRDWAPGVHRSTDEPPYGGGAGMVMRPGPIFDAVESLPTTDGRRRVALMTPQGQTFNQAKARELSRNAHISFCCAAITKALTSASGSIW